MTKPSSIGWTNRDFWCEIRSKKVSPEWPPPVIKHMLDQEHCLLETQLPPDLLLDAEQFNKMWDEHPAEHALIKMRGELVPIPRWQRAYGKDYPFSGVVAEAHEMTPWLHPFLLWAQKRFGHRLNACLINWYDGDNHRHYIGPHRDSTKGLVPRSSIVTISLGAERTFRMSIPKQKLKLDFVAANGTVFVLPLSANKVWYHGVPHFAANSGRRISITIRAFE